MSIFQRLICAGAALAALMFALDLFSATADDAALAKPKVALSAINWPMVASDSVPAVRWHTQHAAPAVRIREAFAQFMPGEGKPRPRSTSL